MANERELPGGREADAVLVGSLPAEGLTLDRWAERRAPDVFAQASRGRGVGSEADRNSYNAAARRLRECLRDHLRKGNAVLGVPARSAFGAVKPVSPDALDGVIEAIAWYFIPPSTHFGGERLPLRLYRPDRFGRASGGAEAAATQRVGEQWLENLVKAEALDQGWTSENLKRHGKKTQVARKLYKKFSGRYKKSSINTVLSKVLKQIDRWNRPKANSKPN